MSNLQIGTLVMLRVPSDDPAYNTSVPNDAIGEVKDGSKYHAKMALDEVAVDFPSHPSHAVSKLWRVKAAWLIPLGGVLLEDEDLADNPYHITHEEEESV